jgi:hypothetical protein
MQRRLTPAERPISFSDPMVRAILDGRKTQTRRVVKPQPPADHPFPQPCVNDGYYWNDSKDDHDDVSFWPTYSTCLPCPYGKPGDRLWVREAWAVVPHVTDNGPKHRAKGDGTGVTWQADWNANPSGFKWKPSIHMPRWASRITLEITSVRVERLGDISEADAISEGVLIDGIGNPGGPMRVSQRAFKIFWQAINGPESWAQNPWVWVIEFQKVEVTK